MTSQDPAVLPQLQADAQLSETSSSYLKEVFVSLLFAYREYLVRPLLANADFLLRFLLQLRLHVPFQCLPEYRVEGRLRCMVQGPPKRVKVKTLAYWIAKKESGTERSLDTILQRVDDEWVIVRNGQHLPWDSVWGLLGTHHLLLMAHLPNLLYIKISLGKIILSKIGFNYLKEKDLLYNIAETFNYFIFIFHKIEV